MRPEAQFRWVWATRWTRGARKRVTSYSSLPWVRVTRQVDCYCAGRISSEVPGLWIVRFLLKSAAFQGVGDETFRSVFHTKYICVFQVQGIAPFKAGEIGVAQVGICERCPGKISAGQVSAEEVGLRQVGMLHVHATKNTMTKIGAQIGIGKVSEP